MDKYRRVRKFGNCTSGQCFLVHNDEDNKLYVLKTYDMSAMTPPERTAVTNEARVMSSLDHPNVVKFTESFMSKDSRWFSIVYVFLLCSK